MEKIKNIMKRMTVVLCMAVITVSTILGSGATEVQAASKNQKALRAYAKYLKHNHWNGEDESMVTFGLIDANRDGVKELVVYDDSTYSTYAYGYCSGKVKEIAWAMCGDITFFPKDKMMVCSESAGSGFFGESYYKYDGKKAKQVALSSCGYDIDEYYSINNKEVSKKKYNKYVKSLKLGKGTSSEKINMHKNTKRNRKTYLK